MSHAKTHLPVTAWCTVDGFRIHFLDLGRPDASPVLLLHGGGTWLYSFRHLFAPLVDLGYRVLALDMPGHGYTAAKHGLSPAYTLEMMTSVLGAFMDDRSVRSPVHLVGNSWGGGWALRFAQVQPTRAASLALLAPSGFRARETWLYESLKYPLVGELTAFVVSRTLARRFYRRAFFDPAMVSEEMVDAAFAPMAASRENRRAQYKLMRQLDWRVTEAAMPRTTTPALVLWGRQDKLWPVTMAVRFGAALPHARVEVFEQCGHLPHEELPGRTLERLHAFWATRA